MRAKIIGITLAESRSGSLEIDTNNEINSSNIYKDFMKKLDPISKIAMLIVNMNPLKTGLIVD